ncbi:MAG: phytanoyl-CoA dioxygenase family protein [Pseudomonadota bacterium]
MLSKAEIRRARSELDEHGFTVVPNVLRPQEVADVRQQLLDACEKSEADEVPTRGYVFDPDGLNRRVFHLFNLDPIFVDLIQRDIALDFVKHCIGEEFLISNFSANITAPGSGAMMLHADQGYVAAPWPSRPLACNVAWVLDDLTPENGGTRYVPGSHLLGHGPDPEKTYETEPIAAPAGSIVVMEGRLWHQSGENRTANHERAVLFGYYVLRWLRPQINWNAALWPETIHNLDPEFLHLLGFYTGNVEFQIPPGIKAVTRPPDKLVQISDTFVLGNSD